MKSFFKIVFASLLSLIIFSLIGLFIIIGIAATLSSEEPKQVNANSVLVLDLNENFPEQTKSDAFTEILSKKKGKIPSLSTLVNLIHYAAKDSSIKGIYIKCQQNPNGYAASEEIRTALLDFKKSKNVVLS
jgi:protease-4